ncbi:hypothetical protein SAMN04488515_0379 [Cognatiyoonia koreensis]|uniref:DUF1993 domain-containing protein n=2 Tax=Cognatiyoonia koreensis TaxID=364200 RepID=A0A1I0N351_9RHOB|nr:hypothetical protein SAMN04488515_0379 [Cognatiyoonia koreensis]
MDDIAIHALATGSALRALERSAHLIELVAKQDESLLGATLAPGQFDCAEQLRTVTIFGLRTVLPVIGRDWSLNNWDRDIAAMRGQIVDATAEIKALNESDFRGAAGKRVQHQAGEAMLDQSTEDYLVQFALPNLWFHLSMAYAILRQAGVDIGKADFDGLHYYPPGFSWT